MSCGYLMFNPTISACDWPANVVGLRPECATTFSYFTQVQHYNTVAAFPDPGTEIKLLQDQPVLDQQEPEQT